MLSVHDGLVSTSTRSGTFANKTVAGSDISRTTPPSPMSSHTLHSIFADSAVDMDATTPARPLDSQPRSEAGYFESNSPPTSPQTDQTLSEKMRQLIAMGWNIDGDHTMAPEKKETLKNMLKDIGAYLDAAPSDTKLHSASIQSSTVIEPDASIRRPNTSGTPIDPSGLEDEDDEWIDESELIAVRNELALTVQEMRLRQEEQRHLHQLTIQKLEAVAQRCLAQEQQADDLLREIRELRRENHTLGQENDQLRERLTHIEEEAAHKDVAVNAMSSAVAGLEGWIESAHVSRPQTPVEKKPKRQKVVIRGKGRFRGRYYVDEDGDHAVAYSLADAAAGNQELQEGVKAWLRGFRDVEEELRQHESPGRSRSQGRIRSSQHDEDEWGDFESPNSFK